MDIKSPSSEPAKSYEKANAEKTKTEKAEKQEVAKKSDDKPKPKNKIERSKIDIKKETKNKIQREKIDLDAPTRNKIQREKINLDAPTKNKIERPKIDLQKEPRNKIQREKIDLDSPTKNKIERSPTNDNKNTIKHEENQLSLEKTKEEMKQIDWKSVSKNWTIKLSVNKEITLNPYQLPSKENPLYKHKQWLQTVYNHKKWNLNDDRLRTISAVSHTTIYKWRKKFNIPSKQPNKKPFNDGKQKECGRCHQIKPHNEFKLRNDKRKDKPYLRSNCSQCKSELNQIYLFKNKRKILSNINNGKYKEKCPECDTKFIKLPAFDFHHLDKNHKLTQRIRTRGNWKKTMERLEQEKTIPICKNCHSIKQATVFNKYSEIITRKNSFENTIEGLEKNIHQYMRSQLKYEKFDQIKQVKPWIKKRIVTEKLFNGKCVGCGEDKLPSLQFHHRDPKQKTYQKWSDLSNLSTSKIINKLKEDNAICLCANCHSMTESRHLEQNLGEILEKPEMNELVTYYKEIHQKINNYSFPNQPELLSKKSNRLERNQHVQSKKVRVNRRLESKKTNYILSNPKNNTGVKKSLFSEKQIIAKLNIDLNSNTELFNNRFQNREFRYGEAWKKYLSHITKLLNEGKEVQTKNLAESVGVNARNTRKNIQKLITKGLISINGEHNNRTIILTEKGRTELEIN